MSRRFLLCLSFLCVAMVLAVALGRPIAPRVPRVVLSPSGSSAPSAWDEPQLSNPITVQLSDTNRNLKLSQAQDYILVCPGSPLPATYALVVWGGHNVVFQNCNYQVGGSALSGGAQFKNQTGTLWLHDLHFSGVELGEGIDLQEPGTTTVVMRDVLIDTLQGSQSTNHADCLQTWSGPQRLLVDGFTCTSNYQGLFLLPNQDDSTTQETVWDFRHVNLHLTGAFPFTLGSIAGSLDLSARDLYVSGVVGAPSEPRLFAGGEGFEDALAGTPPNGDYVTPTNVGSTGVDDVAGGIDPAPLAGEQ